MTQHTTTDADRSIFTAEEDQRGNRRWIWDSPAWLVVIVLALLAVAFISYHAINTVAEIAADEATQGTEMMEITEGE